VDARCAANVDADAFGDTPCDNDAHHKDNTGGICTRRRSGAMICCGFSAARLVKLRMSTGKSCGTGVQWQDAAGNWHDVEGWRGPLDEVTKGEGRKVWGLSEALYGAGPFRWVVYQSQQGEVLVASESFDLPDYTGKVSRITVEIGP
jgi:hypothetical protein